MALRGSIECLTKCTNQLSHQHVWLLTNVTNEKAKQTMRPIEIETFGKSLTICRASRTALYIYDYNVFLLWIHFFPSLLLIFKLIRRPNITLPLPQPKQFEKKAIQFEHCDCKFVVWKSTAVLKWLEKYYCL